MKRSSVIHLATGSQHRSQQATSRAPPGVQPPVSDPVRMYLTEVGRTPLLTAPQEIDLAMRMESGALATELLASIAESRRVDSRKHRRIAATITAIRDYERDPSNGLSLSRTGRERPMPSENPRVNATILLLHRVEDDAETARRQLIEANLRLVVSVAKRYIRRGTLFLDLIQDGNIGLMRATETFDHSRGFKFSTYAMWWIRQAITRGIADQSRTIRVPVHVSELNATLLRVQRRLVQDLGREPLPIEIGDRMGISADQVAAIRSAVMATTSLEAPVNPRMEAPLHEVIEDTHAVVPTDFAISNALRTTMVAALRTLSERERTVVELRFGLNDDRPRTLEEVGRTFDLTRERIRQIEAKALSKLRHPSSASGLSEFLR